MGVTEEVPNVLGKAVGRFLDKRGALIVTRSHLRQMRETVETALLKKRWPPGARTERWESVWSRNGPMLARRIKSDAFAAVDDVYGLADDFMRGLGPGERASMPLPSALVMTKTSSFAISRHSTAPTPHSAAIGRSKTGIAAASTSIYQFRAIDTPQGKPTAMENPVAPTLPIIDRRIAARVFAMPRRRPAAFLPHPATLRGQGLAGP
jgi:hypothetical protein